MKDRALFFRIEETIVMIFIDLTDNTFGVFVWEEFATSSENLTGWLPLATSYTKIMNIIIKHGGVLYRIR